MTQNQKLLNHLKAGRAIDPLMAQQKFGVMRLAARILDLRQMGHNIQSIKKTVHNRFGEECTIAFYKLLPQVKK